VNFKEGDKVVLLVGYGFSMREKGTVHTVDYIMDGVTLGMVMLVGWDFGVNPENIREATEMDKVLEGL
jgi:hypothetical protein